MATKSPGIEPVMEPGEKTRRIPEIREPHIAAPEPIEEPGGDQTGDLPTPVLVEPPVKAKRELSPVPANVFVTATGRKPEASAGFLAYVRIEKLKGRTIPEWEEEWTKFMNRPVG